MEPLTLPTPGGVAAKPFEMPAPSNQPLRSPPAAAEPPATEPPASTGRFQENPLREGTDDFREPMTGAGGTAVDALPPAQVSKPTAVPPAQPVKKAFSKGKHSGDYDPVAENGPIFVGWQKPVVALLISGRQDGYLEPCGCAGLERMKGGLTRRHSLFKTLRAQGWPVVGMDCGGLIKGFGRQAELKFHLSVDAMKEMGYSAIALGKTDLRLPGGELLSRVASSEELPSLFLSANVAVLGFETGMTATHRIIEAGGQRIGITSVLGAAWQKEINNAEIEMADPQVKLREVLPKLKDGSDLLVLLAHASVEESKALAAAFPDFDVVVTAGGNPEPPQTMEILPGGTRFVEVGEKGMQAVVLGVYENGKIEYQRVPLDSRFEDSPDMKEYMRQYQQQLKRDGLAGLGIRQVPNPRAAELGKFVGSKECESCHETSYEIWQDSGHAKAWKTLVELEVPRINDPECISCHVVGWHPTEYFPYESGFLSEAETPELVDVGCETCHGPGEKHIEAEMGADKDLQKKLQQAMVVTKEQAEQDKAHWCMNCHDLDNSPDFNFEEYWPEVEHYED
ncbi:MAG: multiheme c-type cytochrome [Thermoguttaceae bacterium]